MTVPNNCEIVGCENRASTRGWCAKHYSRWMRNGDPEKTRITPSDLTLEGKLLWVGWEYRAGPLESDCWAWSGTKNTYGYGMFSFQNKNMLAHRESYRAWVGDIPEGLLVRHQCDTRDCINPSHLELGTITDNNRDKARTGSGYRPRGEKHHGAKLTWSAVNEIRKISTWTPDLRKEVARKYGVSVATVSRVVNHKIWKEATN